MYHTMTIAGVQRDLPICKVSDDLYIGAFVIFGDVELTVKTAEALLKKAPEYDYMISAEAKGIPLIYEMARQSGQNKYFLARKAPKLYMSGVFDVKVNSITTAKEQHLYLDKADAELMRGKTGRVYGSLMSLLTVMKGLPLAYNRDLQEDKEGFLDTSHTVITSLTVLEGMLSELSYNTKRMEEACSRGFLNATEMADYLVGKGVPFREAHHITGHAVALAEQEGKKLEDLPLQELRGVDSRIDEGVYAVLDYRAAVRRRETPMGTGPKSVARQIADLGTWLDSRPESAPDGRHE